MTLENQASRRVVFLKDRHACLEDEEEATRWIDERQTAVEREVQLTVIFMTGVSQIAERPVRPSVQLILGDQAAGVRQRHQD